jgi:hypothetical protein
MYRYSMLEGQDTLQLDVLGIQCFERDVEELAKILRADISIPSKQNIP